MTEFEEPPDKDTKPQCLKPPCYKKIVTTKFYLNDDLWESMPKIGPKSIDTQIKNMLKHLNNDLSFLDNGGYEVVSEKPAIKLSASNVKLKQKYKDRLDSNIVKLFDKSDIFSYGFSFQEAVEELPDRNDVDVRILLIPYSWTFQRNALAEEHCLCQPAGFGCIVLLTIGDPADWSSDWKVFSHEIGHVLGAEKHDDQVYKFSNKLIMWPVVERKADIWSPAARKAINLQDHRCLKEKKNEGGKKIDQLVERWSKLSYKWNKTLEKYHKFRSSYNRGERLIEKDSMENATEKESVENVIEKDSMEYVNEEDPMENDLFALLLGYL